MIATGGGTGGVTGTTATGGEDFATVGGGTAGEGLCPIIRASGCNVVPEFKSAGRGFGKGGAIRGRAVGATGAGGAVFDGKVTGVAGMGFDFRTCADLVLDVLHFTECIFEQSCRSIRFRSCSMPCNRVVACAGCSRVLPQTITIKTASTNPSLMRRSSHTSRLKDTNDNVNQQTTVYRATISPPP